MWTKEKYKKARLALSQASQHSGIPKASPTKAPPPPPPSPETLVKFMEGNGQAKAKGKGKEKGKGSEGEPNACYNYGEGKGCKYGDACKFKHDRLAARRQKRCLACGQEGHFRPDCPLVAAENRQVRVPEGLSPPKGPPPKDQGQPKAKAKSAPLLKGVTEDASTEEGTAGGSQGSSQQAQEALLAEAAKLLKGVVLKPVRVENGGEIYGCLEAVQVDQGWLRSAVENASDPRYALVDSGATNALRPARAGELGGSRVIQVDLASGTTELHVNKYGTLLSPKAGQIIIPAGYLVQLGDSTLWKRKGCSIQRGKRETLSVEVVKGCPLIPRDKGLVILEEYESRMENEGMMMKPAMVNQGDVTRATARQWLRSKVAEGWLSRKDQLIWLRTMFPDVPLDYITRVAGGNVDPLSIPLQGSPWNRRKRRSIMRSRQGEVLVHLFAGMQKWKCKGIVLEVEKSKGADLMSPGVWQHLLAWAVKGVIGGVVGGPPCRTVSCCRTQGDGGPPPVRGRDEYRWGIPGLPGHLYDLVRGDSVLWLRFLLLYAVAQASADHGSSEGVQTDVREKEAYEEANMWRREFTVGREAEASHVVPPADVRDPVQLAKWALQQAAARMNSRASFSKDEQGGRWGTSCLMARPSFTVFFGWEQPSDPEGYMPHGRMPNVGWATWWAFEEWKVFSGMYSVYHAHFDQGKLGHVRPEPTTFATTSWALYEMLDQQCLTKEERARFGRGPVGFRSRLQQSASWAPWALGLTERVIFAWHAWGEENGLWEEVTLRQAWLRR